MSRPLTRRVGSLLPSIPPLIFLAVLVGIAASLVGLIGTAAPRLDAPAVHEDGSALYLGSQLYQSPAAGYTGWIYTPLFPAIESLLNQIHYWAGWPLLVSMGATLSLVGVAAVLAYAPRSRSDRLLAALEAIGIGALCWWLVGNVVFNFLYEGRQDHFAWAISLIGLVLVPRALRGSSKAFIASVALLSAGFWGKQTSIAVAATAALWAVIAVYLGLTNWRRAGALIGALLAANLATLAVLNVLTNGWEWTFNFVIPTEHAYIHHGLFLNEIGKDAFFAVVFTGGLWGAIALRSLHGRRGQPSTRGNVVPRIREWLGGSGERQLAALLGLFVVVAFLAAEYFRRKQGNQDNQYLGLVWGLGLFGAIGFRFARRDAIARLVAAAVVLAIAGAALFGHDVRARIPRLAAVQHWRQVPKADMAYARTHLVYDPYVSYLSVVHQRVIYPGEFDILDLLAAGRQPTYLVNALLSRRFDALREFRRDFPEVDPYSWAYGKWEANYVWKLNRVIRERYGVAPGPPSGFLARRPGPERASWMRSCFGPFKLAGASFRIHAGGGFWCRSSPGALTLRATPAPLSEVVTTRPVRSVAGPLAVSLGPRAGRAEIAAVGGSSAEWQIDLERTKPGGSLLLEILRPGQPAGRIRLRGRDAHAGRVRMTLRGSLDEGLRLRVGARSLALPGALFGGRIRLRATQRSEASFDLRSLRIR